MLSPAFGGMTAFIKETEPLLERGQGQVIRPDERMYTLNAQLRSLLLVVYLAMIIYVFNFIKLTTSNKPFVSFQLTDSALISLQAAFSSLCVDSPLIGSDQ